VFDPWMSIMKWYFAGYRRCVRRVLIFKTKKSRGKVRTRKSGILESQYRKVPEKKQKIFFSSTMDPRRASDKEEEEGR
jgi:hypothetical protein